MKQLRIMRSWIKFISFSTVALLLLTVPSNSYSLEKRYEKPTVEHGKMENGLPLDYCLSFGTNCGQPAADYFCRQKGFDRAVKFTKREDVGHTKTLKTRDVCQQKNCDTFTYITCEMKGARYNKPVVDDKSGEIALDYCLTWGAGCGEEAANYFCQKQNFPGGALSYKKAENIGHTKILKTGQICKEPNCDGFAFIECLATFPRPTVGGVPMDWCLDLNTDCGEIAAIAFCQKKGFIKAIDFEKAENIGYTRTLKTIKTCEGNNCDGFAFIKCEPFIPGER